MAGLGFFAGGLADSLSAGFSRNQQADFQQKELQIQQQGQENQQKRFQMEQDINALNSGIDLVQKTIDNGRSVGHSEKEIQPAIQPLIDNLSKFGERIGYKGLVEAKVASFWAAPPSTAVQSAQAAAKVNPQAAAKPEVIGQDEIGEPVYGSYNKQTQKYEPIQGSMVGKPGEQLMARGASAAAPASSADPGQDFLNRLPERARQQVQDLADYTLNPNTFSTRIQRGQTQSQRQIMVGLAEQYAAARGQKYDQAQFNARNSAVTKFATGPEAKTTRSFNVLVSHLDVLNDASKALKNGDVQAFNQIKNLITSELGRPAPNTFEGVRDIVSDELAKAIVGGATALGDRDKAVARISAASSPAKLADVINYYQRLAAGQLKGLEKQYEADTGLTDYKKKFLFPRTQQVFNEDDTADSGRKDQSRIEGSSGNVRFSFTPGQ